MTAATPQPRRLQLYGEALRELAAATPPPAPPPRPRPAWLKPILAELRNHPGRTELVKREAKAGAVERYRQMHPDITFRAKYTGRSPSHRRLFDIYATAPPLPTPAEEKAAALRARFPAP